jgi:hypothetical protein
MNDSNDFMRLCRTEFSLHDDERWATTFAQVRRKETVDGLVDGVHVGHHLGLEREAVRRDLVLAQPPVRHPERGKKMKNEVDME